MYRTNEHDKDFFKVRFRHYLLELTPEVLGNVRRIISRLRKLVWFVRCVENAKHEPEVR